MKVIKKMAIVFLIIVGLLAIIGSIYTYKYSMDKTESFEVNSNNLPTKVLIASQGSDFKMGVVSSLIDSLETRDIYIKIIDVTDLDKVNETNWNAIVILHTWENWKPQSDASEFVLKCKYPEKLIVVATSGSGDMMIGGVDGISSASMLGKIPEVSYQVLQRINKILEFEVV